MDMEYGYRTQQINCGRMLAIHLLISIFPILAATRMDGGELVVKLYFVVLLSN